MKIVLAKTAGFCFGVKRAVDLAYKYQNTKNTYTFGPIIHNDTVIAQLSQKGVSPIDHFEDKPIETLIIRSHGVVPQVYEIAERKGITIADATCPYVKKIHKLVRKYSENGFKVIIVGNKAHPEVEGINGWACCNSIIVKDLEEIKELSLPKEKEQYLIVAQTTYKREAVEQIIKHLEAEGYHFEYINTICDATKARQEEAIEIAKTVQCMFVIGSHYSSNTLKLYEICQLHCSKSYCIADASELTSDMIKDISSIGITAGASTPSSVIEEVVEKLRKISA